MHLGNSENLGSRTEREKASHWGQACGTPWFLTAFWLVHAMNSSPLSFVPPVTTSSPWIVVASEHTLCPLKPGAKINSSPFQLFCQEFWLSAAKHKTHTERKDAWAVYTAGDLRIYCIIIQIHNEECFRRILETCFCESEKHIINGSSFNTKFSALM